MGTWGTGIYSNDIALDIKPAITALTKLPFTPDQIVDHLCELFPEVATNEGDEDYSTFWFEPHRDCRRLVGLSYAAMGILSMAAVAA
jgi:hypothetical protein